MENIRRELLYYTINTKNYRYAAMNLFKPSTQRAESGQHLQLCAGADEKMLPRVRNFGNAPTNTSDFKMQKKKKKLESASDQIGTW